MCVCKMQIHLFSKIIAKIVDLLYLHDNSNIVACVTVRYSKMCINSQTQPQNGLEIAKYNQLILSISTELCHKNSILGSQNGHLNIKFHITKFEYALARCVLRMLRGFPYCEWH